MQLACAALLRLALQQGQSYPRHSTRACPHALPESCYWCEAVLRHPPQGLALEVAHPTQGLALEVATTAGENMRGVKLPAV